MVKLNTDGTSKINKVAGCGGFVRDHLSVWRIDFSNFLGLCNTLVAELWVCLKVSSYQNLWV